MKPTPGLTFVVMAAVLLSGCGTIRNLASGDPDNYGGVQIDLADWQTPRTSGGGASQISGGWQKAVLMAAILPGELSLTFVADTLTLPVATYMRNKKHPYHEPAAPDGAGNPVNAAGRPAEVDSLGPPPLDWEDADSEGAQRKARRSAQQNEARSPSRGDRPLPPPFIVPPLAVPEQPTVNPPEP